MQFPLLFLLVEHTAPIELDEAYHQSQSIQNEKRKAVYPPMENMRNVDELHGISTDFFNLVECCCIENQKFDIPY